jgi:predicted phosphoadenosine phosphosulfate sulfurtransferase
MRVEGVNFGNIYCKTKALGFNKVELPTNHTWKSYVKFLLNSLPIDIKNNYIKKFKTYIKYWRRNGSALNNDIIDELKKRNYPIKENGISNRGNKDKINIKFTEIPNSIDDIKTQTDILSWKKMAICIIKNDITCKSLNFGVTKDVIFNKIKKIETAMKWSNQDD